MCTKNLRKQDLILTPKPNITFYSKFCCFLGSKLYSIIQDKMKNSKIKYMYIYILRKLKTLACNSRNSVDYLIDRHT